MNSDARVQKGRRRGTEVGNAFKRPWVVANVRLFNVSPVKDLKRP